MPRIVLLILLSTTVAANAIGQTCIYDPSDGQADNGIGPPPTGAFLLCQHMNPGCAPPPGQDIFLDQVEIGIAKTAGAGSTLDYDFQIWTAPLGSLGPPGRMVFSMPRSIPVVGTFPNVSTDVIPIPANRAFEQGHYACVEWSGPSFPSFFAATDQTATTPQQDAWIAIDPTPAPRFEAVQLQIAAFRSQLASALTRPCSRMEFTRDRILLEATVGLPYNDNPQASGGVPPYFHYLDSNILPPGLTLDPNTGEIQGIPTTPGVYSFEIEAVDSAGCYLDDELFTIVVNPAACSLSGIFPALPPPGVEGIPYMVDFDLGSGGPATFAATNLPTGLTIDPATGIVSGVPTTPSPYPANIFATDGAGCSEAAGGPSRMPVTFDIAPAGAFLVAAGQAQPNPNTVTVHDRDGLATNLSFAAYGPGQWGVDVAVGDTDGNVYPEILTGPGPGPVFGPHVRAFDRLGRALGKVSFYAYGTLKSGVHVGASDIDADGFAEILTGAGAGAVFGPHLRAFDHDGGTLTPIARVNLFAYATLKWGVHVGAGDLESDGYAEPLTGAGPGAIFGAQVRGWNVDGGVASPIASVNFFAFPGSYGARVAAGDVDGDGMDELAATHGAGPTVGTQVLGFNSDGGALAALPGFDVTPFATVYGAIAALADLDGDGAADLGAGAGPDATADATVRSYSYGGAALAPLAAPFLPFTTPYGSSVAAGPLGSY